MNSVQGFYRLLAGLRGLWGNRGIGRRLSCGRSGLCPFVMSRVYLLNILFLIVFFVCGGYGAQARAATSEGYEVLAAAGISLKLEALRLAVDPAVPAGDSSAAPAPARAPALVPALALPAGVQAGSSVLALRLALPSGTSIYAQDADSGLPTVLRPAPGSAGFAVRYPPSVDLADPLEPGKRVRAYEGLVTLFVIVPPERAPVTLLAELSLLLCSPQRCIPVRQRLRLTVPAEAPLLTANAPLAKAFAVSLPSVEPSVEPIVEAGSATAGVAVGASGVSSGAISGTTAAAPSGAQAEEMGQAAADALRSLYGAATPASSGASTSASAANPAGSAAATASPLASSGVAASASPAALATTSPAPVWDLHPRYPSASLEPQSLGMALLFGLLAGLILNVMPCVLPVLTIKISSLLHAAGSDDTATRLSSFRQHNLYFAAGIGTWFACLVVAVGGLGLAWGGLFQHRELVYGLLVLVFLLGLSLFDLFTLPVLDFKLKATSSPRLQAYLSGFMATLLATPCSGPLLGGVLGWAASRPLPVIALVFLSTGLGMSLPYLALAAFPGAARLLPRPGPWTGVMERLVGFFLLGTSLYLLSILPESFRLYALTALLVVALAAWIWGRWGGFDASRRRRFVVRVLAVCLAGGAIWWSLMPAASPPPWQPLAPADFRAELGRQPLLVTFTADWCPSCKVLERTVLTPDRLAALSARYGLRLIKVDITRPDADAEGLLRSLGSLSIPVTALFPAGAESAAPLVLRDLYTSSSLEAAAAQAFAKESSRVVEP